VEPSLSFYATMKIFPYVILLSAVLIAAVAGFFSVSGIAALFAGASLSAMAMAGSLEFGKLVSASFLYRYWNVMSKSLRTYMMIGTLVLVCITSLGIYGYLANAYASVASGTELTQNQVKLVDQKIISVDSNIARSTLRLHSVDESKNQAESRLSTLVNKSRSTRSQESAIKLSNSESNRIQSEIESLQNKKDSLNGEKVRLENSITGNKDLGSFMYVSRAIGVPLDIVVKWFILILVLVFDPMSISLFLAFNIASKKDDVIPALELPPDPIIEPIVKPVVEPVTLEPEIPAEQDVLPTFAHETEWAGPYFRNPQYDWEHDDRWRHDPEAIAWRRAIT
jgi:hypothetical protein